MPGEAVRGAPAPARGALLETPRSRAEEVKPHFAPSQTSSAAGPHRGGSKAQWLPQEVPPGAGGDRKRWVEAFQASWLCPPPVRGQENKRQKKQLCGKKEISTCPASRSASKISPHPTMIRGAPPTPTNPAQLHQSGSCRAGARLQETLPSAPPAPAPPLPPPEAPRVTSACVQAGPGEHADTDSIETKSNQSI